MMPADEEAVRAVTAPVDALLAQVVAAVGRIAQKQSREREDLLAVVAGYIESDDRFRYAIAMLLD